MGYGLGALANFSDISRGFKSDVVQLQTEKIVGEEGKTHNGLYDISMFTTITNYTVVAPTTCDELIEALEISKDFDEGPMVIRIPREISFSLENDKKLEIGRWKEIKKGKKILFIATGSMLKEILSIDEQLKSKKIDGTIVSAASIKPLDEKYILDNLDKYDNIFWIRGVVPNIQMMQLSKIII